MKHDGKKIRKVQFWMNPTPFGKGGPRWDADVTLADGTRERRARISLDEALELLKSAMG